ncbi:methyl-accepting chemotaxis protein [Tropicibacter sp. S64]|uniref:methyl-accepting chemotaxis protein n=1 Tax=Tropicibacter sp. S64 TaxID=3415122 RepID=UPI003C7BFD33
MFTRSKQKTNPQSEAALAQAFFSVVNRTQATIQFRTDGTIITANENFLKALKYSLDEVVGKHHSMFLDADYVKSDSYRQFWKDLAAGKFFTDQFPRVAKDGSVVWIQATYAPYIEQDGSISRVIKIATDITERQNGIENLSQGINQLSLGNLSHRVPDCGVPDIRTLNDAFNTAVEKLSSAIAAVKDVSDTVANTADELGTASSSLSARTETQAATLEETAAAIDELTSTVKAAAAAAKDVERYSDGAKATAESGGKVVEDAVLAMANIEKSSKQISQIIVVIDDIAFQTNLLALNAGVEAARAGKAGLGFAVVAAEVRMLAQRSAEAAQNVKALIEDSTKHVSTGAKHVNHAGSELEKIVASVFKISGSIAEIARGAEEQSASLSEINAGVGNLDMVTQQNVAMVQQAIAASQVLKRDARELARQTAAFRTSPDERTPAADSNKDASAMNRQAARRSA